MGFGTEFKKFALRGNVIDLAVGVVIGAAFGRIVNSLVQDILTPTILDPALKAANLNELNKLVIPGTAIKYGNFISELISFTIVAFALFLLIKLINTVKHEEPQPGEPTLTTSEKLLMEIRDSLKKP